MSSLTVRAASDGDVDAITSIYGHAVESGLASFEYDPPDRAEMARRRAAVLAGGYPYLVAERDGVVLGYAYASVYRTRPAYRFVAENSVYVKPGAHGGGIGKALLSRLIADCAALGLRQMIAVIGDLGNHGSIALHRSCGFALIGVLPAVGWKHGRWVDSVLMQRALGDGDGSGPI